MGNIYGGQNPVPPHLVPMASGRRTARLTSRGGTTASMRADEEFERFGSSRMAARSVGRCVGPLETDSSRFPSFRKDFLETSFSQKEEFPGGLLGSAERRSKSRTDGRAFGRTGNIRKDQEAFPTIKTNQSRERVQIQNGNGNQKGKR